MIAEKKACFFIKPVYIVLGKVRSPERSKPRTKDRTVINRVSFINSGAEKPVRR